MNFIELFDCVRIINLVSRADRRKETDLEFKRHGFVIDNHKVKYFEAKKPSEKKGFASTGVRGCFLSHLKVLEEAFDLRVKNILILEDDIQFSKYINDLGVSMFQELNKMDWDIAYFGHVLEDSEKNVCWKTVSEPILTAHCYAINGKALKTVIDSLHQIMSRPPGHPEGGPMHYDGALNTIIKQNPDLNALISSKKLGFQRSSETNLHELSILDKNILLKEIVKRARKLKNFILRHYR